MALSNVQRRKVRSIYRRWLKDEAFFDEIASHPDEQFSDTSEVLRNLGTAIAYAQALANKLEPRP